jgi:hypothetical protein
MVGFFLMVIVGAVIVILTVFAAIIVRQVAVIMLIILAPLAFALAILPNTKKWFDRWRKTFIGVLMLFPIVSLVFSACTIAANIMGNISQTQSAAGNTTLAVFYGIAAIAVAIIPLFAVYPLMKGSFKAIDDLTGGAGSKLAGYRDKAAKWGGQKGKNAGDRANARIGRSSWGQNSRIGKIMGGTKKSQMRGNRLKFAKQIEQGKYDKEMTDTFANDLDKKMLSGAITNDMVAEMASKGTRNGKKISGFERQAAIAKHGQLANPEELMTMIQNNATDSDIEVRSATAAIAKEKLGVGGGWMADYIGNKNGGGGYMSAKTDANGTVVRPAGFGDKEKLSVINGALGNTKLMAGYKGSDTQKLIDLGSNIDPKGSSKRAFAGSALNMSANQLGDLQSDPVGGGGQAQKVAEYRANAGAANQEFTEATSEAQRIDTLPQARADILQRQDASASNLSQQKAALDQAAATYNDSVDNGTDAATLEIHRQGLSVAQDQYNQATTQHQQLTNEAAKVIEEHDKYHNSDGTKTNDFRAAAGRLGNAADDPYRTIGRK